MLPRLYRTESEKRIRQINTLKVFNDNVTEVLEGSEYQIAFKAGANEFCLRVLLTNDFPNEKPVLIISPAVIHPWANSEGDITSAPGLLNFTVHSDLGRVVQAIIREFERTPPPLVSEQSCSTITSPSVPVREVDAMGRGSPSYTYNYTGMPNFSPPTRTPGYVKSVAFPDLNSLTVEELEFLNECPERQEEFIDSLPQVREMNKTIDELISNIEELADSNLAKEDYLQKLNGGVAEKMDQVANLALENERLNSTYLSLSEKYSPQNIKDQLSEAADSSNSEGEKVVDAFLNGDIDVDKFLNSYIQIRTISQMRRTKEEKLSQQLESLKKAGY